MRHKLNFLKLHFSKSLLNIIILAMIMSSCSDDDNDSNNNNSNNTTNGQVTFTVDGEEISFDATALHIITDDNTPNATAINEDGSGETTMQIILRASPGDLVTYDVSNLEDSDNHVIVSIMYSDGNGTFVNTSTSDGQISISEYNDSSISGSFNATLENAVSGEEISINNGSFTELTVSETVE